ncbi:MAG: hypothetical protein KBG28_17695 [Kofleriaceae bacterium]|nr:hypothetical protein [Kofleriaceae bacterium]MBP9205812.1 hypothetical protein [Kofleriaceae bacterium]
MQRDPTPMAWSIEYPTDFDDYLWFERSCKGWFKLPVTLGDRRYEVCFYDPTRLGQDIAAEFEGGSLFFCERNVIVVPEVTRANMDAAIGAMAATGQHTLLVPVAAPAGSDSPAP